jgi:hypothetical protein
MKQVLIDFCERRQRMAGRMAGRMARKYGDKFPIISACHWLEGFWLNRMMRLTRSVPTRTR